MVKIFHILAGKANPNTLNGVNKVVDAVATEQHQLGFDVTVVGVANNTIRRHNPCYKYELFKGNGKFLYPKAVFDFLIRNSDENSIFHFHSVFIPWYLFLIKKLKKNNRIHIFLTPHGQYVDAAMKSSLKKRIFFSLFDKKILKEVEATHVIGCVSEKNPYILNNTNRVVCIPNGFGNQKIIEFDGKPQLIIGYLGRLECNQKGLDNLIEGFSIYKKQGGKARLWLAGKGPDEVLLKNKVSDVGLQSFIEFKGAVFDNQKWNFINDCAALISPSRWEGIPTSCLEAAAVSRPLLISETTNLGDYVKKYNAGLVIDSIKPENISKLFFLFECKYTNDYEYNQMCFGAKQMIECDLNWSKISKKIVEELYGI